MRKAYRRGCDVARRLRTILNFPSSDEQRRPVFTTSSRSIWELYLSPSIIVLNTALHLARRPPPARTLWRSTRLRRCPCGGALSAWRRRSRKRKAVAWRSPAKAAATDGPATDLIHARQAVPAHQWVPLLTAFGGRAAVTLEPTKERSIRTYKGTFCSPVRRTGR